jgi:putative Mn2+ efflux pump MntP
VLLAFGITLSVIGVVIWLPVTVIGVITTVTILVLWIREAREEMAELPLEHH